MCLFSPLSRQFAGSYAPAMGGGISHEIEFGPFHHGLVSRWNVFSLDAKWQLEAFSRVSGSWTVFQRERKFIKPSLFLWNSILKLFNYRSIIEIRRSPENITEIAARHKTRIIQLHYSRSPCCQQQWWSRPNHRFTVYPIKIPPLALPLGTLPVTHTSLTPHPTPTLVRFTERAHERRSATRGRGFAGSAAGVSHPSFKTPATALSALQSARASAKPCRVLAASIEYTPAAAPGGTGQTPLHWPGGYRQRGTRTEGRFESAGLGEICTNYKGWEQVWTKVRLVIHRCAMCRTDSRLSVFCRNVCGAIY